MKQNMRLACVNAGRTLLCAAALAVSVAPAHAQRIAADGSDPVSGLMLANDGYLYGMTYYGGAYNDGTIYKINPNGTSYTIVHSFAGTSDGANPMGTLFQGSDGNIYGATFNGGTANYGTIFKLSSGTLTTLHSFTGTEGAHPVGITGDSSSTPTLYGVSYDGGNGVGTIFQTTSIGTTTSLYTFSTTDGSDPDSAPILDGSNLYGTTSAGGANSDGTIYQLNVSTDTLTTLLNFSGANGNSSRCTFYRDGTTLYGTTRYGGNGVGTVFKIDESGTFTNLATSIQASTPWYLDSNVIESSTFGTDGGALFGTANGNGSNTMGCIYSVTNGVFTVKHNFTGAPSDGREPSGLLMRVGSVDYGVTGWVVPTTRERSTRLTKTERTIRSCTTSTSM